MSSSLLNPVTKLRTEIRTYKVLTISSLVITILLTGVSIAGLVMPANIYPTQELHQSFSTNDLVNLIIGFPILLASIWLTHRGKLVGLLFWPGVLMYVVYNYIAYMVAMPINLIYVLYVVLVLGSLGIFIVLVTNVDYEAIQQRLQGYVYEKLSGGVLVGFGGVFFFRAISILINPVLNGTTIATTDLSVLISDIILALGWIIGGVLLWHRKALGYLTGGAFLFQGATLFIGLILFLIINPILMQASVDIVAVLTVFVMSVICNIPFGLFLKGVIKSKEVAFGQRDD